MKIYGFHKFFHRVVEMIRLVSEDFFRDILIDIQVKISTFPPANSG